MKFGYTIVYVDDVAAAVTFYGEAFGIEPRFVHEGGDYAELATGETALAFAAHALGQANLPAGYTPLTATDVPAGIEVALVTDDVPGAVDRAIAAGASVLSAPATKPWGQVVAYVRAPHGLLIELCTPVGG